MSCAAELENHCSTARPLPTDSKSSLSHHSSPAGFHFPLFGLTTTSSSLSTKGSLEIQPSSLRAGSWESGAVGSILIDLTVTEGIQFTKRESNVSREVRGIGTRAVARRRRDVGQPDNSESWEGLFHGGGLNRLKCCGVEG